ncbi:MAG TPA: 50S ribosomal protein L11 methyltransferase [Steroidobacteraceae bacterium]|nr:50S ribosomal protein L11 methyltransferase [Steroidobacteraceae bacterium]
MTGWWQLSFGLDRLDPDRAEQACLECGATSVTFADAADEPVLEPAPGEFRLWRTTRLAALFPGTSDPAALGQHLVATLGLPPGSIDCEWLEERAWEREWLRDFHAMRFGRRLWICPHHEEVAEPGAAIVRLDPGLAFGTGTHPTTALCLEWLDGHVRPGDRVIDFGCGSGILAIAALKLGAREAQCFDIDPQALTATRDNAADNAVQARIAICESAAQLQAGADLLVANILSGPLRSLAPTFASLVRPGGFLVLAGLLEEQAADVTQAYTACFDMRPFGNREGWVGLAGTALCPGWIKECSQSAPSAR